MTKDVLQHEVIAVVKDAKEQWKRKLTEVHHLAQKSDLLVGLSRIFKPLRETEGAPIDLPPAELKRVTQTAAGMIASIEADMVRCFDSVSTQDEGNMLARADVVVRDHTGTEVFRQNAVPATHLLFLEKQLTDIVTFVDKLPVLDPAETWNPDPSTGTFRSEAAHSRRSKKIQKPVVLYHATPEHPAQTQLIVEDVDTCSIETVKLSGALSAQQKNQMSDRARMLLSAVKAARQQANTIRVPQKEGGKALYRFIFGS